MKKLLLSLDNLRVDSFDTTGTLARRGGTVLGHSQVPVVDSAAACGYNTEGPTCGPENTCGYYYDTCAQTHDSCYPCDVTVACDSVEDCVTGAYCNTGRGQTCIAWC